MQEELLDYFDENQQFLGKTTRSEIHEKGLWHKTFHCWLIQWDNKRPYLLFQQRSWQKDTFPDKLDITVGGHILSGEDQGLRELQEELGIEANWDELLFLGVRKDEAQIGNYLNREFCYTYFLESRQNLLDFKLQSEELSGLVKAEARHVLDLLNKRTSGFWAEAVKFNQLGELKLLKTIVRRSDLLPHPESYYRDIATLTQRYFTGERNLHLSPESNIIK
jgi:isopentenyldiphosphate isomerase